MRVERERGRGIGTEGTLVPWSMERADHCDSCSEERKSSIAGCEISIPDDSRRSLHEDFTAEKIPVGGGRGISSIHAIVQEERIHAR